MAGFVELDCDQGTDFVLDMDLTNDDGTPRNITGSVFTSTIKKSYYSANPTANLTIVVLNAANGNVMLSLNAAISSNIAAGRYLFDIRERDASNTISRVAEGIITINPQITKS